MKETKEKTKEVKITSGAIFFAVFVLLLIGVFTPNINIEFKSSCNTGEVGLNYSGHWLNQTEFLNEYIKINGIDNLNCEFEGSVSGPWWMMLR